LAHHYTEAGLSKQAIGYWHRAGQRAIERSAHLEAISHLQKGLALLKTMPDTSEGAQQELLLLTTLGPALMATQGYAAPEVEGVYARARELCQQAGDMPHLFMVLRGLWVSYLTRGELSAAYEFGKQLLQIAQQCHDTALLLEAHRALGSTLFFLGELASSWAHVQGGLPLYDAQQHRVLTIQYGQDIEAVYLGYSAWHLWMSGYPDQALHTMHQAIQLGQQLTHPYTLGFALTFAAMLYQWQRETQGVQKQVKASIKLAQEHMFPLLWAMGTTFQGWVQVQQGDVQAGLEQMRQGIAAYQATGAGLNRTYMLALLAEGYRKAGMVEEGLAAISDALTTVEEKRERWWEAELHRLKSELLLQLTAPDIIQAEAVLHQALEVARNQHTKSWELRAAISLARLWKQQNKRQEAYDLLAPVYNWFTEGFDTADLIEAKSLLDELSIARGA
jgi:predicted ATPase